MPRQWHAKIYYLIVRIELLRDFNSERLIGEPLGGLPIHSDGPKFLIHMGFPTHAIILIHMGQISSHTQWRS